MRDYSVAQQHLQVQTSLSDLSSVLNWFNHHYQTDVPRPVLIQCQTILAEGFTNAVRHAHRHKDAGTPIEIEVELLDDQIEICVWDSGPEFNLTQRLQTLEQANRDAVGGRGIRLLARLADRLSYERTVDQRNCLRVYKRVRF